MQEPEDSTEKLAWSRRCEGETINACSLRRLVVIFYCRLKPVDLRSSEDKYKMAGQTERSTDQLYYEVSANLLRWVGMIFSNSRAADGWVCPRL